MYRSLLTFFLFSILSTTAFAQSSVEQTPGNQNDPSGVGFQEFSEPNLSFGDFGTAVPINLPAGQGGLKPSLGLGYSSNGFNGIAGLGWSMGTSCIERRGPTKYVVDPAESNSLRPYVGTRTSYEQSQDNYFLDGQRLLACDGTRADCPSGTYRPEMNSFLKVTREFGTWQQGAYVRSWKTQNLDGTVVHYEEADSIGVSQSFPFAAPAEYNKQLWCVSRITNGTGAEIQYHYDEGYKTSDNQLMLKRASSGPAITWGPDYEVYVDYETRPDVSTSYARGYPVHSTVLVKAIEVKKGGNLLRKYEIDHDQSPFSGKSRLTQVRMSDQNGQFPLNSPKWKFQYGNMPSGSSVFGTSGGFAATPGNIGSAAFQTMDLNGDGKQDIVQSSVQWPAANPAAATNLAVSVWLNTGSGWDSTSLESQAYAQAIANERDLRFEIDFYDNEGAGAGTSYWIPWGIRSGDFNGDGLTDFIQLNSWGGSPRVRLWIQNRSISSGAISVSFDRVYDSADSLVQSIFSLDSLSSNSNARFSMAHWRGYSFGSARVIDINGDGLSDVLINGTIADGISPTGCKRPTGTYEAALINTGNSFVSDERWISPQPLFCGGNKNYAGNHHGIFMSDLNGDGLIDLVQAGAHLPSGQSNIQILNNPSAVEYHVWLNLGDDKSKTGKSSLWQRSETWSNSLSAILNGQSMTFFGTNVLTNRTDLGWRFSDLNSDGYADLVKAQQGQARVAFLGSANGLTAISDSFYVPTSDIVTSDRRPASGLMDLDGDGNEDIVMNAQASLMNRVGEENGEGFLLHATDLLVSVTSPLGGKQNIFYKKLDGKDHQFPGKKLVVGRIEVRDGRNNTPVQRTDYVYKGGKFDHRRGQFNGFRYVKTIRNFADDNSIVDQKTAVNESWFHQEWCLAGALQYSLSSVNNSTAAQQAGCGYAKDATHDFALNHDSNNDLAVIGGCADTLPMKLAAVEYLDPTCSEFSFSKPVFNPALVSKEVHYGTDLTAAGASLPKMGKSQRTEYDSNYLFGRVSKVENFESYTPGVNRISQTVTTYAPVNSNDWLQRLRTTSTIFDGDVKNRKKVVEYYYSVNDTLTGPLPSPSAQNPFMQPRLVITKGYEDANGSDFMSLQETQAFDAWGNVISSTSSSGITTSRTFDATGTRLLTETMSGGSITIPVVKSIAYDSRGMLQSQTDGHDVVTTYEYDDFLRLRRVANGKTSTETVYAGIGEDADDGVVNWQHIYKKTRFNDGQNTDAGPSDIITREWMDGLGRVYQSSNHGSGASQRTAVVKVFNSMGAVKKVTHPFYANSDAEVFGQESRPGIETKYDAFGRVRETFGAGSPKVTFVYGIRNSNLQGILQSETAFLATTSTTYGIQSAVIQRESLQDLRGQTRMTSECIDCNTNLNARRTIHVYNGPGELVRTILPANGGSIVIAYDALGRKKYMRDPNMSNCLASASTWNDFTKTTTCDWNYRYDSKGNLIYQKDAKGQTIRSVYDDLNREIYKYTCKADGKLEALSHFEYDMSRKGALFKERHLVEVGSISGLTQYGRFSIASGAICPDNLNPTEYAILKGMPVYETNDLNLRREYQYTAFGELFLKSTRANLPQMSFDRTVDSIYDFGPGGQALLVSLDIKGQGPAKQETLTYSYDEQGRVSSYGSDAFCAQDGASLNPVKDIMYDASGRVTSKTFANSYIHTASGVDTCRGREIGTIGYSFHEDETNFGRLSSIDFGYFNRGETYARTENTLAINYPSYDTRGNIKQIVMGWGGLNYTKNYQYDWLSQLENFQYIYPGSPTSIQSWNNYIYDDLGNRIQSTVADYQSAPPPLPTSTVTPVPTPTPTPEKPKIRLSPTR